MTRIGTSRTFQISQPPSVNRIVLQRLLADDRAQTILKYPLLQRGRIRRPVHVLWPCQYRLWFIAIRDPPVDSS